jgi:selenium-binding protein 1
MALARPTVLPDPTFYPSPRDAIGAPRERLAYVAAIDPTRQRPDALDAIDVDPASARYGQRISRLEMPNTGDELHHFGWNACSATLCPYAAHPHVERRYLIVPGLRSSRLYIVDTKPDPAQPRIVKVIEADAMARKAGYSRPHTVHCGPEGIYISALGNPAGDGPGGVMLLDHNTFDIIGAWERDRGPQVLAYDIWWNLGFDTAITSEWGTPNTIEQGLDLDVLTSKRYGRAIHLWDLRTRKHQQTLAVGENDQMVLELRPAHDPSRPYGFVGVVVNVGDLSSSIWLWRRTGNGRSTWEFNKVIEIAAEPANPDELPPALKPFKAVPPLVTDIDLTLDDQTLYVSCWGTGELRRYDVSTPDSPVFVDSVHLGGIVRRAPHPAGGPLNGGPQMVEVSRDGQRVYVTNSLYASWDAQFYPEGIRGWMVKLDAQPGKPLVADPRFFPDFGTHRPHQVRLQGGDASSDSYCFPSA